MFVFFFFSFIGEETVSSGGNCNLTNTPTWIIDPIDGTTNFVHKWGDEVFFDSKIFRVTYRHTKADTAVRQNTANEASYLDKFQVS